jgi:hypothetical protein
MRIYAPSLGLAVKAYVYNKGEKDDHTLSIGKRTDQELKSLTFHSLPKVFDLLKKELLRVRGLRSLGESNVDLCGDCLQFLLGTLKLVSQGTD